MLSALQDPGPPGRWVLGLGQPLPLCLPFLIAENFGENMGDKSHSLDSHQQHLSPDCAMSFLCDFERVSLPL